MSVFEKIKELLAAIRPVTKWGHLDEQGLNRAIQDAYLAMDWELHSELIDEQEDRQLWEITS